MVAWNPTFAGVAQQHPHRIVAMLVFSSEPPLYLFIYNHNDTSRYLVLPNTQFSGNVCFVA